MALFTRKKDPSVLPEVDQYYKGERRDRTWLAWVLAIVSIAIIVLLLVGLFFAGKWVYNAITDNDEEIVTTEQVDENVPSVDGGPDGDESDNGAENTENQPSNSDQQSGSDHGTSQENATIPSGQSEGTVDAPAQTTTPSTPATGASPESMPETGPGNVAALFLVTSGVAGTTHYVVSRRRK